MLLIFTAEAFQGTDNRKRRALSKTAQSHTLYHGRQFLKLIQIRHLTFSVYNPLQDFQHTFCSLTAGHTFSAAFSLGEAHEKSCHFYHTGILIHNHKAAGSHDCVKLFHRVKVKGNIQLILHQTAAGRSADLYALKSGSALQSAADIINNMAETGSHWNLYQSCVFNRPCQREGLRSRAPLCADGTEPVGSLKNNLRNIGIGFYIVQNCRLSPKALLYSTGRFYTGHSPVSFDGSCKRGAFSADKSSRAAVDM